MLKKVLAVAVVAGLLTGCAASNQTKGTGIGAVTGAVLGGVIGHQTGNKAAGAAIGAIAGATIGTIIGKRMDEQAQELEQVQGVEKVKYDPEQQRIEAKLNILFDFDKASIRAGEAVKLDQLASVFAKYPENIVIIEGHTDDVGSDSYNYKLSQDRAAAIELYLRRKNLGISSLSSVGYGETRPVVANTSEANRAMNRRVEIKISVDQSRVPQQ